jgi:BASS family bile acid:Na+ symporter
MTLQQLVMLALQVSILLTVFGFGLHATANDMLFLVRRPGLLARSLLAMFVVMPVVALTLAMTLNVAPTVEIALVALAISPVPPLLPKKEDKAGGHTSYALGLMVTTALLSIVLVPATIEILSLVTGRRLTVATGAIVGVVLKAIVLPLVAGMAVRAVLPGVAKRLVKIVTLVAKVLLPVAVLALLAGTAGAVWDLIGNGTVLAIVVFTVVGLAVGHLLGGPHPDDSVVLALSTACRHPAIALGIAAANYPDQRFGGTLVLTLIVSAIVTAVYVIWRRRQARTVFA